MIVTVTMNPAIDRTVEIDCLERGGLNRISHVEIDAGGKGINVSKTIHELGGQSIAVGFIAGSAGKMIRNVLDERQIEHDFIEVSGETRTNTKVFEKTGELTELNEPGPVVKEKDVQALLGKMESYANPDTLFVLAGSVPRGVKKDIYRKIIELAHGKGAKILLDADGEFLTNALDAGPDMIKPNKVEIEQYAGMEYIASEQELKSVAEKLMEKGITAVAVSMGKSGAMFLWKDYKVKCPGLKVKAHSAVGAGDAMVAALSYSWSEGLSQEDTVKMCMAVSAGAVTTVGTKPPSKETVETLLKQVVIEKLD